MKINIFLTKKTKLLKTFIMLMTIFFTLSTVGCRGNEEKQVEVNDQQIIPKHLDELLSSTEELEEKLEKIKEESEKTQEIEIQKVKENMIEEIEKQMKGEDGEESVGVKPESIAKSVETQEEKIYKIWTELNNQVEKLHEQWNLYKVEAVEDKADQDRIEEFEEKLNNLTISINNQDYVQTLTNTNEVYNISSYFTSIYNKYESDILKLRYFVNRAYIIGLKEDWDRIDEGLNQVESQYKEVFKEFNKELDEKISEDEKQKQELELEKLDLSIQSMTQSAAKQDVKLLDIKKNIVIENIKTVNEETK